MLCLKLNASKIKLDLDFRVNEISNSSWKKLNESCTQIIEIYCYFWQQLKEDFMLYTLRRKKIIIATKIMECDDLITVYVTIFIILSNTLLVIVFQIWILSVHHQFKVILDYFCYF